MTDLLSLKYRPKTFQDMVGQKITALVFSRMVTEDRIPSGLLFSGVRGSGKTTAARILAGAVDDTMPIEIDAASHGSVGDVREMIESLRYSAGGARRVVIYDEAHSMSREAFNALLKTLEEPPAGVTFILVTTEPDKIPGTVKSRLMEFVFRRLLPADITARLMHIAKEENIALTPGLAILLGERADGSMRDGIMLLDQCSRAGISSAEEYLALAGEADVAPTLVQALLTGDHAHIFEVAEDLSQRVPDPFKMASSIVAVLKDLLVLRAGGMVEGTADGIALRKELARLLEPERILAAMRLLWDLRTKARQSSDPRGNLDLVLVLVSEVFTRGRQTTLPRPAPVQPKPVLTETEPVEENVAPRQLTLEEL